MNTLHRRLGHISIDWIESMIKNGQLHGISTLTGTLAFCEPCIIAKMKKLPFKASGETHTTCPFELVHADVEGPITLISREGYWYWLVIVDDFTHFPWVYLMKYKSEVPFTYQKWKSNIQAYFQLKPAGECITASAVQYLWSDNEGEFISAQFWDQLRSDGTQHETSAPDTPEQNGLAK